MNLNIEQQQAVTCINGPIIIKAGPGTGKTKTLTARIEYLISEKNILPSSILALTFTRKAAAEMRERLFHLPEVPTITTFHSFAHDILKKSDYDFEIITDQDRNEIIHTLVEKTKGKEGTIKDVKEIGLEISKYKNTQVEIDKAIASSSNLHQIPCNDIIEYYNNQLKLRNLVDYDDLIVILYKELQNKNNNVFAMVKHIQHVLVDEFQDTNRLQYEVIKLFSKPESLFVIGDPYQSIYGFRGADASIFKQIKKDFPEAMEIVLQDNYRSTKEIIQSSSALFPEINTLRAHNADRGTVQIVTTCDEYTEAQYVLNVINKKVGGTDLLKTDNVEKSAIRFADIAIIYRTHHIGRTLQKSFLDSGIPFQIVGEDSPYAKPTISFISNILHYSIRKDRAVLQALLYSPVLKIPKKILRIIRTIQQEKSLDYQQALREALGPEYLASRERAVLSTIIHRLEKMISTIKDNSVVEAIHMICKHYNIDQSIELQQYISSATQFDKKGGVSAFVAYLSYLQEHEFYDPRGEKVTLMTMHASKGLEFNTVCVCGFEEGIIPSVKENVDIEEEKRLFYVAVTRAKKYLYLIYPQERNKERKEISRFFSYLSTLNCVYSLEDEVIAKRNSKLKKWKEKKSQLPLF